MPDNIRGLHARLLDQLGEAICSHALEVGTVLTIEEIEAKYSVSRSVVRETVRVLEAMGLVRSRRRIGIVVLSEREWNLYDPHVIRWNLASSARLVQLQELTELRSAIEPQAARLAASRISVSAAGDLMGLAGRLWAAGHDGDDDAFVELDIAFHGAILSSSGNKMFARLDSVVGAILRGRTDYGYVPPHPHTDALQLHLDVAAAIQRGDPDAAESAMLHITQFAINEMTFGWDLAPDSPVRQRQ